jgi:hypothetical protein
MVRLALQGETVEKRLQAVKNCIVLTREGATARKLLEQQAPTRLAPLLRDANDDIRIHTYHIMSGLAESGGAAAVLAALQQANIFDELLGKVVLGDGGGELGKVTFFLPDRRKGAAGRHEDVHADSRGPKRADAS